VDVPLPLGCLAQSVAMPFRDRLQPHKPTCKRDRGTQGFAKSVIGNVRFVQNLLQYRVPFRERGYVRSISHDEPS
jgi:hypothetical protein